ncbi:MAG: hypothetical protein AAFS12_02095 [Cyanobacteria bacterium J06632_19]
MQTLNKNSIKQLNLSGSHIEAIAIDNVKDYPIKNSTIVVNPQMEDAYIGEPPKKNVIPPFSSTILKDTQIAEAKSLILLEVKDTINLGNIILEDGWNLLGDTMGEPDPSDENPFPKNTPLWISPQDNIGIIEVDPYLMTRQDTTGNGKKTKEKFLVKVNLWFAPAQTNCAIHNQHDFIEIHTQVVGIGRMQKFKQQDYPSLYEDMVLAPGYTTYVPFCEVKEPGEYVYPWHQYYSDNDCIWMAIEYHPVEKN